MLSLFGRLFSIPWRSWLARICCFSRRRLSCAFRRPASPFDLTPLTDRQRKLKNDEFIESIDTNAICALASKHQGGLPCTIRCRHKGSFNVCFILDFTDGSTRLVRLPIEPAVHDAWDKVRSEVYTMQYVRDHTDIPVSRVYAYGRSRLRRDTYTHQVFIILDYIEGRPLTKKMLRESSEDCRRQLFENVIDMFAQLRMLEFPLGGSLMPNTTAEIWTRFWRLLFPRDESFTPQATIGPGLGPRIVGAFSMRKNELQVDGYEVPRFTAATSNEFFREQYHLLHSMWKMPVQELGREEAEREEFALHAVRPEKAQKTFGLQADASGDSFYLCHPDLRVNNIIVNDELRVCGVIDWEFSVTVPRRAFLPPSWITGHDTGSVVSKPDLSSEFFGVLSSRKQRSSGHSQLAQDWSVRDDVSFPMAYIYLDPSDLVLLFYRCIYPSLYNESPDKVVPNFFQRPENEQLQAEVVRRLHASEQYTQYLKDNDLFDDEEEPEWQQLRGWVTEAQKNLQQLRGWTYETREILARMERDMCTTNSRSLSG
ncbi:phosphotransferase enzyme family protein [Niveomyces insectorum RCEF 264]|uniref:Phosphotransferase enzyme family protein n=1 Tax=Niveomyces insectorum RCEF 264 TaxID=1081102 RepID=A0A162IC12_9HYPO|nr:phosphotransferase enzyme family protein [Niveomyces insectorum RCEF 264]